MLRIKGPNQPAPTANPNAGGDQDIGPELPKAAPNGTGASPEDPDQEEEDQEITGTTGDKLPKPLVVYMDSDEGPFQCDHCRYYVDAGSCMKVDGQIDPSGCCNLFNPQSQSDSDDTAMPPAADPANQEDSGY